jgi:hypothetical protein
MENKLPSGAVLEVTPLDCGDAYAIFQQVMKVIGLLDIDLSKLDMTKDFKAQDIIEFKRPLAQLLSNSELEKAAKKCLTKCTYDGMKVTEATWNPLNARQDYLFAMFFALKENCSPFLDGVFSDSKA